MSRIPELEERVRALLADVPNVAEKKMFGSVGFMVNGKLCVGVGEHKDHSMMVRVGRERYAEALARPGAHPAIMRDREMKGYVFLTDAAYKTDADLQYWVNQALAFNRELTKV